MQNNNDDVPNINDNDMFSHLTPPDNDFVQDNLNQNSIDCNITKDDYDVDLQSHQHEINNDLDIIEDDNNDVVDQNILVEDNNVNGIIDDDIASSDDNASNDEHNTGYDSDAFDTYGAYTPTNDTLKDDISQPRRNPSCTAT